MAVRAAVAPAPVTGPRCSTEEAAKELVGPTAQAEDKLQTGEDGRVVLLHTAAACR